MSRSRVASLPWKVWAVLLVVAALVLYTALRVDLAPEVESDFFFSPGDPALRDDQAIQERFGTLSQVVALVSSEDVAAPSHLARVREMTRAIEAVPGVTTVRSLASGPDGVDDARESPLWRRLLLAGDGSTSFVITDIEQSRAREAVHALEEIAARHDQGEVRVRLAGVPYTVEVMRRKLVRDFSVFSTAAVLVFGLAILWIFRSGWILLGTLATCVGAVSATLIALHTVGMGIGLLTANLTTIVFVLTLSHTVFMASNWQGLPSDAGEGGRRAAEARRTTLRASLGSAATTLLGFASLLFVPARPLEELGVGGAVGAVLAIAAAYLAFPVFLARATPGEGDGDAAAATWIAVPSGKRALALVLGALVLALGVTRLQTDPSLLAYFDEEGEVHAALAALDRAGGSSPLSLAVQDEARARLDAEDSMERLRSLQVALEEDPAVGRVISLPVVLAEIDRVPLASYLKREWVIDLLGPQTTGAFLTEDRRQTLYLLQMRESGRDGRRSEVIARLRGAARERNLQVPLVGGIYALQARLADLVATSVLWSLCALVLLFTGIAGLAAASLRVGIAAGIATGLVPLAVLGGFGVLSVPLDVIAAPAASVGLGLAADAALHLISAWRRRADGEAGRWEAALREQWRGVLRSTGIVAAGFGLFALSSFPPTRRFGSGVAASAILGAALALWLLPALAARLRGDAGR